MRLRISIRGRVRPSVGRSVRPSVGPSVGPSVRTGPLGRPSVPCYFRMTKNDDFDEGICPNDKINTVEITDFSEIQLVRDRRTDGPTDRPTDQRTDIPSYRDVRTQLKNTR